MQNNLRKKLKILFKKKNWQYGKRKRKKEEDQ